MRHGCPATVTIFLASVLFATPSPAQKRGLLDSFDAEPEQSGSTPLQRPPRPTTGSASTAPDTIVFPLLARCASSLAGLPPGSLGETVALLETRIAFWQKLTFDAVPPFRNPKQAEFAASCFEERLALIAALLPEDDHLAEARSLATELQDRWGNRLGSFLNGEEPQGGDLRAWWSDADAALGTVAQILVAAEKAAHTSGRVRDSELEASRAALAELQRTVADVERLQDTFGPDERRFWVRALAWRAREAGLAIDSLQRDDLRREPDRAYALLIEPPTAAKPGEQSPDEEATRSAEKSERQQFQNRVAALRQDIARIAPDAAEALASAGSVAERIRRLRPGDPRDWSPAGDNRQAVEEILSLHIAEQTLEARIVAYQRKQADTFRSDLQLRHELTVLSGVPEAESRAKRDSEWQDFKAGQEQARTEAITRWQSVLPARRAGIVNQMSSPAHRLP
jgi:hypothetical protein